MSSLPNSAHAGKSYNLKYKLEVALFDEPDPPIRSVDDLVTAILKHCVDFFKHEGPCGVRFHDCFQSSISGIVSCSNFTARLSAFGRVVRSNFRSTTRPRLRQVPTQNTDVPFDVWSSRSRAP